MEKEEKKGFWQNLKHSLNTLLQEMRKDSAASAGPSGKACCHLPVEELERKRAEYRRIAEEKAAQKRE